MILYIAAASQKPLFPLQACAMLPEPIALLVRQEHASEYSEHTYNRCLSVVHSAEGTLACILYLFDISYTLNSLSAQCTHSCVDWHHAVYIQAELIKFALKCQD